MRIVVVGAGIVGSSVGYHLARKRASVQVLEAGRPGGGTSAATFAYLNAIRFSGAYANLRVRAIRYWDDLAVQIGGSAFVHRDGCLFYTSTEADAAELELHVAGSSAAGLPFERWTAARVMAELEPDLQLPDTPFPIIRLPDEGRLEVAPIIARLLADAREHGAEILTGERVTSVERVASGSMLVRTSQRWIDADRVVLCVGSGTEGFLQPLGIDIPVRTQPGVTVITRPLPARLRHVVYVGRVHFKPDGGGRILAGRTDYRTAVPSEDEAWAYARETIGLVQPWVRGFAEDAATEIEAVRIGTRSIPADGLPVIGCVPSLPHLYVATMHSGISLGGLIGRLVAEELVDEVEQPELEPYRPDRFLESRAILRDEFTPWAPGDRIVARPTQAG